MKTSFRKTVLLVVALAFVTAGYAQSPFQVKVRSLLRPHEKPATALEADSLAFLNGPWKTSILHMGGLVLRQCAFTNNTLFDSNQYISVLYVKESFRFDVVADTALTLTENFVDYAQALAGINGSFFDDALPWNSVDYLMIDSVELARNHIAENKLRAFNQLGTLTVSPKGRLDILKAPYGALSEDLPEWESTLGAEDVLTSGPLLRVDGRDQLMLDHSFYTTRHPRTAVAIRSNGKVLLVVVDGRNDLAAGMSLTELQHIMRWLKAEDALNLDGGGSSTMCVRKNILKSVRTVNHPSDNGTFDHAGARKVANALVVK